MSDSWPDRPSDPSDPPARPPVAPSAEPPYAPLPAYSPPSPNGPWHRVAADAPEGDRTVIVVVVCIIAIVLLAVLGAVLVAYLLRPDIVGPTAALFGRPDATKGPAGG